MKKTMFHHVSGPLKFLFLPPPNFSGAVLSKARAPGAAIALSPGVLGGLAAEIHHGMSLSVN